MAEMAILQNLDKCIRCNGCVISCKRTHNMGADNPGVHRMAPDQRVIIKSRAAMDMGPFIRYSCWHCSNPPCAPKCPKKAVIWEDPTKISAKTGVLGTGAVWIDHAKCDPTGLQDGVPCSKQCLYYCQRGGYPRIGVGSTNYTTPKSYKCSMCTEKISQTSGGNPVLPTKYTAQKAPWYKLPVGQTWPDGGATPPAHTSEPSCVYTCPAQAMVYDTLANIKKHAGKQTVVGTYDYVSRIAGGHVYWVSSKTSIVPPKADPFVEDHVSPMVSDALASPLAKALFVPTLVAGGLLAISARRANNEATTAAKEV